LLGKVCGIRLALVFGLGLGSVGTLGVFDDSLLLLSLCDLLASLLICELVVAGVASQPWAACLS